MVLKGKGNTLQGIFGLMLIATALAGCGSSSTASSSSTDSAASSTNSVQPTVSSAMGTIALSSPNYQANAASSAIITVYRSGSGSGAVSVNYTTVNGSALAGTDYTASTGSLAWSDGDTSPRTLVVPVNASAQGKTFAISLTSIEGRAGYGSPASAIIQVSSTATSTGSSSSSAQTTTTTTTASSSSSSSSSSTATSTRTATLQWTAPTDNTDGSALTNLLGYNIYYGTSTGAMTNKIAISTVGITNYVIQNMQSGNWYFAMTAVNSSGAESTLTSTVQATL